MKKIEIWLATGVGAGYFPIASGTVGSLWGILFSWIFSRLSWPIRLVSIIAFLFLGVWVADEAEKVFQEKDSSRIVIDEIGGMLISLFFIPWRWPWIAASFFLFRLFDIFKPWPIARAEELPGGIGVMLDDVGAGIYTNLFLQLIRLWL